MGQPPASLPKPGRRHAETAWVLVKLALFTVFVPGTVGVWVPYRFYSARFDWARVPESPAALAGIALIALGAMGYAWCAWGFAITGRGTPAPVDPPKVLVVRGLYRLVRNPMYLSVGTVVVGESLLFQSLPLLRYVVVFWVAAHLFVVLYEEPTLRQKFGPTYEDYCRAVPRWLPRVKRK